MNSKQTNLFGFLNRKKPDLVPQPVQIPPPSIPIMESSKSNSVDRSAPKDMPVEEPQLAVSSGKRRLVKKAQLMRPQGSDDQFVVPTPHNQFKNKSESSGEEMVYQRYVLGSIQEEQQKEKERAEQKAKEDKEKRSSRKKVEKIKPLTEEQKKKIREEAKMNKKLREVTEKRSSLLDEIQGEEQLNEQEESLLRKRLSETNKLQQAQIDQDHQFALRLAEQEQRQLDMRTKNRKEEERLEDQFNKLSMKSTPAKSERPGPGREDYPAVFQKDTKKSAKKSPRKASKSNSKEPTPEKKKAGSRKQSNNKIEEPKNTGDDVGNDCFKNLTFVLTGQFKHDKNLIQNVITAHGGRVTSAVSGKTNYLLQGYGCADGRPISTTNNSVKADQLGKPIIPHNSLEEFFRQRTGKTISEHLGVKQKPIKKVMDVEPVVRSQNEEFALWSQRYAPRNLDEVIGQEGSINKARKWIEGWEEVHLKGNKHVLHKNFAGSFFFPKGDLNSKAMMFSGTPGIGKTTVARLLAKEYGYRVVEYNASDTRNKSAVSTIQATSYSLNFSKGRQKILMILDEVDGLSGGDRGGSAAMIQLIKKSQVPIICICNDRQSTKIKSLGGHCYDVPFEQPSKGEVLKRLSSILNQRGMKFRQGDLMQIIQTFHSDMRQILNFLNMHAFENTQTGPKLNRQGQSLSFSKQGTSLMNMWDAGNKLLNKTQFQDLTMSQRLDLFFVDSQFIPLIIQNCLKSSFQLPRPMKSFKGNKDYELIRMKWDFSHACNSIAFGDILNRSIRRNQDWKMMPIYGYVSSVFPTQICAVSGKAVFPQWLGNNSKAKKISRELRQLENSYRWANYSGGRKAARDYTLVLYNMIHKHLKDYEDQKGNKKENTHLNQAVELMSTYRITPTMLKEHLTDVQYKNQDLMNDIAPGIKASLTKAFNERYNASKTTFVKAKATNGGDTVGRYDPMMEQIVEDDVNEEEEEGGEGNEEEAVVVEKPKGKPKAKPKTKKSKIQSSQDDD